MPLLKQKANNFLAAVASATTKIGSGESAKSVIDNHLNVSALGLGDVAQRNSLQVKSAEARVASLHKHKVEKALKMIDEFRKAVVQRKNRTQDTRLTAKLGEAVSELEAAARKGVVVLDEGADDCAASWEPEFNSQVVNFVTILSYVDGASTYKEAYNNLASGIKNTLNVKSDEAVKERLTPCQKSMVVVHYTLLYLLLRKTHFLKHI